MAQEVSIRRYEADDFYPVIALWNRCLPRDPITERRFMHMILMDPNFDPNGCWVAVDRESAEVVGFILGLVRRVPLGRIGMQEDTGWISVLFVHPEVRRQGIGSQLLTRALDFFREKERKEIWCSSYTPNYFAPGVDLDVHPEAVSFFEKHGFVEAAEAIGMAGTILNMEMPAEVNAAEERLRSEGMTVQFLEPKLVFRFLAFLERNFPGDWTRAARERLMMGAALDDFLIVLKDGEVVGYCQYEGEHFGPFGVCEELRGQKIGSILFYRAAKRMRAKGYQHIWVAWTGGEAKRFYERAGMRVNRRHAIMKKTLPFGKCQIPRSK